MHVCRHVCTYVDMCVCTKAKARRQGQAGTLRCFFSQKCIRKRQMGEVFCPAPGSGRKTAASSWGRIGPAPAWDSWDTDGAALTPPPQKQKQEAAFLTCTRRSGWCVLRATEHETLTHTQASEASACVPCTVHGFQTRGIACAPLYVSSRRATS